MGEMELFFDKWVHSHKQQQIVSEALIDLVHAYASVGRSGLVEICPSFTSELRAEVLGRLQLESEALIDQMRDLMYCRSRIYGSVASNLSFLFRNSLGDIAAALHLTSLELERTLVDKVSYAFERNISLYAVRDSFH